VCRDYYQTKTESRFHNRLLSRLKENDITIDQILALEYVPLEIITYFKNTGTLRVQQKE
jgi:histidinol phosphatase-like enzyme